MFLTKKIQGVAPINTSRECFVLAATHRPDVFDPALLRPGRFDFQIVVEHPDRTGRSAILRVYVRQVPLIPDVQLNRIASATVEMVDADLANLVNETALTATRRNSNQVIQICFEETTGHILRGAEHQFVPGKKRSDSVSPPMRAGNGRALKRERW